MLFIFQKENEFRTDLKKFVEKKISQEKKEEHLCANPNNNLEEKNRSLMDQVKSVPDKEKLLERSKAVSYTHLRAHET